MSGSVLQFSRDYDLPVEIVWDALIDADLVVGWLAEATIEPRVGGVFDLEWVGPSYLALTRGEIVELEVCERLEIATSNIGSVLFELVELEGGTRGGATRLTVTISSPVEPRFAATTVAHWRSNLDQLEDLLRGRPVDWRNWERDRGKAWNDYFDEAARLAR